ncbi:hypothetical protein GUJ93_ZPchr0006g43868 [Zizania palustris]|uniref:Uncharacterized protein n=1 Tax=Zizania palustris TaxID=103762 RepID=A0A8J5VM69_ZIZPA|nr:hypothetical protein GUJ93_ZPchr0006g43868 [Zizania palustris]
MWSTHAERDGCKSDVGCDGRGVVKGVTARSRHGGPLWCRRREEWVSDAEELGVAKDLARRRTVAHGG